MAKKIILGGDQLPEGLGEILAQAISGMGKRPRGKPIAPADQIKHLAEFAKRYRKNPFKKGDVVTPRPDSNLRWAGRPALVIDVAKTPIVPTAIGPDSSSFGGAYDVHVAYCLGNDESRSTTLFWHESHGLEYYDPKKHIEVLEEEVPEETHKGFRVVS